MLLWRITTKTALGFGIAALLLTPACSSNGGSDADVQAELSDFQIDLQPASVAAGEVSFDVENTAGQVHEFVVARTDMAPDELPTGEDGDVAEEGAEDLEVVDEIEDIEGGTSETLTVDLDAGSYVIFCNLPGHYRQGMTAAFDVTN